MSVGSTGNVTVVPARGAAMLQNHSFSESSPTEREITSSLTLRSGSTPVAASVHATLCVATVYAGDVAYSCNTLTPTSSVYVVLGAASPTISWTPLPTANTGLDVVSAFAPASVV